MFHEIERRPVLINYFGEIAENVEKLVQLLVDLPGDDMKLLLGNENVLKELQDCRRGYYAAIFAFWLCIKIIVTRHFFYKKTFMIKVIQNLMEITLCFNCFSEKTC